MVNFRRMTSTSLLSASLALILHQGGLALLLASPEPTEPTPVYQGNIALSSLNPVKMLPESIRKLMDGRANQSSVARQTNASTTVTRPCRKPHPKKPRGEWEDPVPGSPTGSTPAPGDDIVSSDIWNNLGCLGTTDRISSEFQTRPYWINITDTNKARSPPR